MHSMEGCHFPAVLMRHLVDNYFDDDSVYACLLVCHFMKGCVSPERKTQVQSWQVRKVMMRRDQAIIDEDVMARVRAQTRDRKMINKWKAMRKIRCSQCYLCMAEHEQETHDCRPRTSSNQCPTCGLHYLAHYASNRFDSRCPLSIMTCMKSHHVDMDYRSRHSLTGYVSPCSVTGMRLQLQKQHMPTCHVECMSCNATLPLLGAENHFSYRPSGGLVCKRIK